MRARTCRVVADPGTVGWPERTIRNVNAFERDNFHTTLDHCRCKPATTIRRGIQSYPMRAVYSRFTRLARFDASREWSRPNQVVLHK